MSNKKTLSPEPEHGRYSMERRADRSWTDTEVRLMIHAICMCQGQSDLMVVMRCLCRGLDRLPQFATQAKPNMIEFTNACHAIVSRRLWKCLTGYEGEIIHPKAPDSNHRRMRVLSWGDKWIINKWREVGTINKIQLCDLIGRHAEGMKSGKIHKYCEQLVLHGKDDPVQDSSRRLYGMGGEEWFSELLGKLAVGKGDIVKKIQELEAFMKG